MSYHTLLHQKIIALYHENIRDGLPHEFMSLPLPKAEKQTLKTLCDDFLTRLEEWQSGHKEHSHFKGLFLAGEYNESLKYKIIDACQAYLKRIMANTGLSIPEYEIKKSFSGSESLIYVDPTESKAKQYFTPFLNFRFGAKLLQLLCVDYIHYHFLRRLLTIYDVLGARMGTERATLPFVNTIKTILQRLGPPLFNRGETLSNIDFPLEQNVRIMFYPQLGQTSMQGGIPVTEIVSATNATYTLNREEMLGVPQVSLGTILPRFEGRLFQAVITQLAMAAIIGGRFMLYPMVPPERRAALPEGTLVFIPSHDINAQALKGDKKNLGVLQKTAGMVLVLPADGSGPDKESILDSLITEGTSPPYLLHSRTLPIQVGTLSMEHYLEETSKRKWDRFHRVEVKPVYPNNEETLQSIRQMADSIDPGYWKKGRLDKLIEAFKLNQLFPGQSLSDDIVVSSKMEQVIRLLRVMRKSSQYAHLTFNKRLLRAFEIAQVYRGEKSPEHSRANFHLSGIRVHPILLKNLQRILNRHDLRSVQNEALFDMYTRDATPRRRSKISQAPPILYEVLTAKKRLFENRAGGEFVGNKPWFTQLKSLLSQDGVTPNSMETFVWDEVPHEESELPFVDFIGHWDQINPLLRIIELHLLEQGTSPGRRSRMILIQNTNPDQLGRGKSEASKKSLKMLDILQHRLGEGDVDIQEPLSVLHYERSVPKVSPIEKDRTFYLMAMSFWGIRVVEKVIFELIPFLVILSLEATMSSGVSAIVALEEMLKVDAELPSEYPDWHSRFVGTPHQPYIGDQSIYNNNKDYAIGSIESTDSFLTMFVILFGALGLGIFALSALSDYRHNHGPKRMTQKRRWTEPIILEPDVLGREQIGREKQRSQMDNLVGTHIKDVGLLARSKSMTAENIHDMSREDMDKVLRLFLTNRFHPGDDPRVEETLGMLGIFIANREVDPRLLQEADLVVEFESTIEISDINLSDLFRKIRSEAYKTNPDFKLTNDALKVFYSLLHNPDTNQFFIDRNLIDYFLKELIKTTAERALITGQAPTATAEDLLNALEKYLYSGEEHRDSEDKLINLASTKDGLRDLHERSFREVLDQAKERLRLSGTQGWFRGSDGVSPSGVGFEMRRRKGHDRRSHQGDRHSLVVPVGDRSTGEEML